MFNKVTIKGAKQAVQMFGPAQRAVAMAVADSVEDGTIPAEDAENMFICVGVFIHWLAEDDKKIQDYNYKADRESIKRAVNQQPSVKEVLAQKGTDEASLRARTARSQAQAAPVWSNPAPSAGGAGSPEIRDRRVVVAHAAVIRSCGSDPAGRRRSMATPTALTLANLRGLTTTTRTQCAPKVSISSFGDRFRKRLQQLHLVRGEQAGERFVHRAVVDGVARSGRCRRRGCAARRRRGRCVPAAAGSVRRC